MSVQFVFGPSGSGKSTFIYNEIIKASMKNRDTNYILLVPEQYSMLIQRKMVELHPSKGTMNIDVIGFNRLAYRVFDELGIKTTKVLEDFGKSMLLRQIAGKLKDELKLYGSSIDKPGFIDELKSLMSELYQYDVELTRLDRMLADVRDKGETDSLLEKKLADLSLIYSTFAKRIEGEYIVAEEISELLADNIERSEYIKNSVIVLDGYTGFTPIQLKCISKLMASSKHMYFVLTIDRTGYEKKKPGEHELFFLTSQTVDCIVKQAGRMNVTVCEDIFVDGEYKRRSDELSHLEKSIFRYPYKKYTGEVKDIRISQYKNTREEIMQTAQTIRELVINEGYTYKDIGVVTGALESNIGIIEQLMPLYDIPYFLDYSRPVTNNPYIDAISSGLRVISESFSYESVFAFLKSGVISELDDNDIEVLENYVLEKGIKGSYMWERQWSGDVDYSREYVVHIFDAFKDEAGYLKQATVSRYVNCTREFMKQLEYEASMSAYAQVLNENMQTDEARLYSMLYEKISDILDKMLLIMPDDIVSVDDFSRLFELGLKDIALGIIPTTLDMVTIGDITRTRLDGIKVLFILDVNDGIIPAAGSKAGIISDTDKDVLSSLGYELAPTERMNVYTQQFYLYSNMTKPTDKLFIAYTVTNQDNEVQRPSYIINRIKNIFPKLTVSENQQDAVSTRRASVELLIKLFNRLMAGDYEKLSEFNSLFKLYEDMGDTRLLDIITMGAAYSNTPDKLAASVYDLVRLRLATQSVSRLEQYASCAYSYFLKYILCLEDRRIKQLNSISMGNILHEAMERLYRYVYDNMSNEWERLDDEKRDSLVEGFVVTAFDREFEQTDKRLGYLKGVIIRIAKRTAKTLSEKASGELLKPEYFEYRFDRRLKVGDEDVKLTGVVDRGDVYYDSRSNTLRLRIIDYKSGNYDFKINELYEGVALQLSIYMNVMMELVDEQYNHGRADGDKAHIVPEGMYYYQMTDPFVDADSEEKAETERGKRLVLKGLSDGEAVIRNVSEYAMKKAGSMTGEILSGNIDKLPIIKQHGMACDYCEYKLVCRFDSRYGGNKARRLRFSEKDKDMVYQRIIEELGGEADGMD